MTVIVPGRDVERYAPAALASLQAQTERRWRAILVDDGSVDATGAIFAAAARSDPRFVLVRHDQPRGLSAARNTALDLVDTPYLGFLDGDDELAPTALTRLTASLAETGSDFAVAAYVRTRAGADGVYRPGRVQPWVSASTSPPRQRTTIREHPHASGNIVAWSKVSRAKFWDGIRFPLGVAYEDQIIAQQMYTRAEAFDVLPDVAVHWRLRAEGTSITQAKDRLPTLRDYLSALRGGIDVLLAAGASDAVVARLDLILAMDVPPLARIAANHPDPAYAATLTTFLSDLRALPEYARTSPDPTLADALTW